MLRDLGFARVLIARSPVQFQYFLKSELSSVQLVVGCFNPDDNNRFQLFSILRAQRELAATPFILVSETTAVNDNATLGSNLHYRRADSVLQRPFGFGQLGEAVRRANEQRSRTRDILICVSAKEKPEALEALYESGREAHWRAIEYAESPQQLNSFITRHGYRIGTILISADSAGPALTQWLSRFKKTRQGVLTPVVFLSRDPVKAHAYRRDCDLFMDLKAIDPFERVDEWTKLLSVTSKRLVARREVRGAIIELRKLIKQNMFHEARSEARNLLKTREWFWELLEVLGQANEKLQRDEEALWAYQKAGDLNPCSPAAHLGRLRVEASSSFDSNSRFHEDAIRYCPRHPQILQSYNLRVATPVLLT